VVPPGPGDSPRQRLLAAYERYLSGERGLSPLTITKYAHIAVAFLDALPDPVDDAVAGLSAGQVHEFLLSRGTGAKSVSAGLRSLLRYLFLTGARPASLPGRCRRRQRGSWRACQAGWTPPPCPR
jgi:site-specific recombinase XerC